MMYKFILAICLFLASALSATAHSSGHGAIEEQEARYIATSAAAYLTQNDVGLDGGLLPASWRGLRAEQTEVRAKVDGDWVISVSNPGDERTLYLVIDGMGRVVAANFTGVFPYIWDVTKDKPTAPQ